MPGDEFADHRHCTGGRQVPVVAEPSVADGEVVRVAGDGDVGIVVAQRFSERVDQRHRPRCGVIAPEVEPVTGTELMTTSYEFRISLSKA